MAKVGIIAGVSLAVAVREILSESIGDEPCEQPSHDLAPPSFNLSELKPLHSIKPLKFHQINNGHPRSFRK